VFRNLAEAAARLITFAGKATETEESAGWRIPRPYPG